MAGCEPFQKLFIWGLANMSEYLPVRKISETDSLFVFHHPQPEYPLHILLVPKLKIRDISQFDPQEGQFLQDVFMVVRDLVQEFNLAEQGYRLIVNGGEYQKFPQLHFHLVSGEKS